MKSNYKKLLLLFSFFLFIFFIVGFSLISVVGYNSYAKSNKLLTVVDYNENLDFETGYVYENDYSILGNNATYRMSFDRIIVANQVGVGNKTITLNEETLYVTDLFYNAFINGVFKGDLDAAYKNNKTELINAPKSKQYLNDIILKMEDGVIGLLNLKLVVLETDYESCLNDEGFVANLKYYLTPYITAKTLFKLRNNDRYMFINDVLVYSLPTGNYNGFLFQDNNIYVNDAYLKDYLGFDQVRVHLLKDYDNIDLLLKDSNNKEFTKRLLYMNLGYIYNTKYYVVVNEMVFNNIKNHFNNDSILNSESPTDTVKIFTVNEKNIKTALNNNVNFVLKNEYSYFNNYNNTLKIIYFALAMVALVLLGIEVIAFRKSFGSELILSKVNVFMVVLTLVVASLMSYLILVLIF